MPDEQGQVDRTKAAATIRGERLLCAGVGRLDLLAVIEVVIPVHTVQEKNAWFGVVIGGFHDLIPEIAGADFVIDPHSVVALVGAARFHIGVRFGAVYEFDLAIFLDSLHKTVGHADRNIKVRQVAFILGVDENLNVRMIAAQNAHLRAAPRAGGFDGFAGTIEHAHVGHRPGCARLCAFDLRALRAD